MDLEPAASTGARHVGCVDVQIVVQGPHLLAHGGDQVRELGPPRGRFVVGFDEAGTGVYCGGVKALPDGACEFKRMFVRPDERGRGVARELLAALEVAARDLGYGTARLDTGPRQLSAERMFRDAGYRPIANFNENPVASFFGEKAL